MLLQMMTRLLRNRLDRQMRSEQTDAADSQYQQ